MDNTVTKVQPSVKTQLTGTRDLFGDLTPWAEPAWYNTLSSPYYDESHRRLRRAIREYVDEHILPYSDEWEESGEVPREVKPSSPSSVAHCSHMARSRASSSKLG